MLPTQRLRTNGKDFTAKITTKIIIKTAETRIFKAKTKKTIATSTSTKPSILTSINIKSVACFKTL